MVVCWVSALVFFLCKSLLNSTVYYLISNKDLVYSTETSAQYCVITYMEKEHEKEWMDVYITEVLCRTPETNTTL